MEQADALTQRTAPPENRSSTLFGFLINAAEKGLIPDFLIRYGIQRLLKNRLRHITAKTDEQTVENFLQATKAGPIAVAPQKANEQHYELPALFFQKVLGSHLKYSCAYWPDGPNSLDQAEEAALRRTCEFAGLQDGMKILELGCGWGSLSLWIAENFPQSDVTSVSNSHSQREFIEQQAQQRGLSNLQVLTADMNEFSTYEKFDRVVSVEMFEHMRNHQKLMNRIHQWLVPGGQLYVHIFCHKNTPYLFQTEGEVNWMGRYFFTGGMMPSADLLPRCKTNMNLVAQESWNGTHYARTCREWLIKQDKFRKELMDLFRETYGHHEAATWFHRWRLFFIACEELFVFNEGNEWYVSHYLFERETE